MLSSSNSSLETESEPVRPLLAPYKAKMGSSSSSRDDPMGSGGQVAEDTRARLGSGDSMLFSGDIVGESAEPLEEGRKPLFKKNPVRPSKSEVEAHMKLHIPCRSWCLHCMRGRGRNDPH